VPDPAIRPLAVDITMATAPMRPVEMVVTCHGLEAALRTLARSASGDDPGDLATTLGLSTTVGNLTTPSAQVSGIHLGNAFCERLLPEPSSLARLVHAGGEHGIAIGLVTPPVDDAGLEQVGRLLQELPDGAEVVANDIGVLRLLARERPDLVPVAGRQLARMIKDPRLPSADWAGLYPHGLDATPLQALYDRFRVAVQEMDVPPFAKPDTFRPGTRPLAVHVPYGFALTGRSCQIGSLHQPDRIKFAPGHPCRHECLAYVTRMQRPPGVGAGDLETFQRGNSMFYRHTPAMMKSVGLAVERGRIARLVFSGDWHEDRRPD